LTEVVDDQRPAPTEAQVLSMENFMPTRTQQLTILQPHISVYFGQHENCDISKKSYKTIQKSSKVKNNPTKPFRNPTKPFRNPTKLLKNPTKHIAIVKR
jgi:hypothetical protein